MYIIFSITLMRRLTIIISLLDSETLRYFAGQSSAGSKADNKQSNHIKAQELDKLLETLNSQSLNGNQKQSPNKHLCGKYFLLHYEEAFFTLLRTRQNIKYYRYDIFTADTFLTSNLF